MRKLKHVTVEEDPNYFFCRKSDLAANRITPANFFYTGDLVCQWKLPARHNRTSLISIQWTAAIAASLLTTAGLYGMLTIHDLHLVYKSVLCIYNSTPVHNHLISVAKSLHFQTCYITRSCSTNRIEESWFAMQQKNSKSQHQSMVSQSGPQMFHHLHSNR